MSTNSESASASRGGTASASTSTAPGRKIPFHRPSIGTAERDAVAEVLSSGWLTTGQKTIAFEEAVRTRIGCGHAVAVNSATAALHLILEALGIRSGDEVVVPTYTFASCGETVRYLGARPRLTRGTKLKLLLRAVAGKISLFPRFGGPAQGRPA